ncbi:MAG: rhomboid family intramembrane serine protease [Spirochaetaceae bacterium]|jgi:membrane associated rhomboid family serine protease|nr:rhomboid family intramembrane serine protease [Spirochaetaceae bacterium]
MNILRRPFRYSYFSATLILIGLNVFVFLCQRFLRGGNLTLFLAMTPAAVANGCIWQIFTYMFVHANFSHIFFNMLGLFIFGTQVEQRMGSREFLLFYLLTGTLAGAFSFAFLFFTGGYFSPLLGASGAIFAVELAFACLFPNALIYIWGILPLRAPVMVLAYTGLELFFSFTGARAGVAHFTHLAGFGFAWLYFLVRYGQNPWKLLTRR